MTLIAGVLVGAIFVSSGWAGSSIEIASGTDLVSIGIDGDRPLSGSYAILNDLNLSSVEPSGPNSYITGIFTGSITGTYPGWGPTLSITGLTKPLFNMLGDSASVSNLSIEIDTQVLPTAEGDPERGITGLGGLAIIADATSGSNPAATISINNVHVSGTINNQTAGGTGGLIGTTYGDVSISNSTNSSDHSDITAGVTGGDNTGGLVGLSNGTLTITESSNSGVIHGAINTGGLVGHSSGDYPSLTIIDSNNSAYVVGGENTGGLVGRTDGGVTISVTGAGPATNSGIVANFSGYTGGLIGNANSGAQISNASNTGTVQGNSAGAGGFIGVSGGISTISGSSNSATVTNPYYAHTGGFIGLANGTVTIENSQNSGDVTGEYSVGGLIGTAYASTEIINSKNLSDTAGGTGAITGELQVGGLIGAAPSFVGQDPQTQILISSSSNSSQITGRQHSTGGLVGSSNGSLSITDSKNNGEILGGSNTGGLVGASYVQDLSYSGPCSYSGGICYVFSSPSLEIQRSSNNADINGWNATGGLVGWAETIGDNSTTITDSYSIGITTGSLNNNPTLSQEAHIYCDPSDEGSPGLLNHCDYVGGLVGAVSGQTGSIAVDRSYSAGEIIGRDYIGGLVGGVDNSFLNLSNSISLSSIYPDYSVLNPVNVGALVGYAVGTDFNSYGLAPVDASYCAVEGNTCDLLYGPISTITGDEENPSAYNANPSNEEIIGAFLSAFGTNITFPGSFTCDTTWNTENSTIPNQLPYLMKCHTVSFSQGEHGTNAPSDITVVPGASLPSLPVAPDAESGWIFAGWSDGIQTYDVGDSYTPVHDVNFIALWVPAYTATFDRGIHGTGEAPAAITVAQTNSITLPTAPTAEAHWIFSGWFDGIQTYDAGASYTPTEDVILIAQWIPAYAVSFAPGDHGTTTPTEMTVAQGDPITLPEGPVAATGWLFAGWTDEASTYLAGTSYTPANDVTLTATWTADNHTVTFNPGPGAMTGTMERQVTNLPSALTANSFVRAGYTFTGWATSENGSKVYNDSATYSFASDISLFAVWRQNQTNNGRGNLRAEREEAKAAAEKAAADKAAADKAAADKAAQDAKTNADKPTTDKQPTPEKTKEEKQAVAAKKIEDKKAGLQPIKENKFIAVPSATEKPKAVTVKSNSVSATTEAPVKITIPNIAKGAVVTTSIRMPDGQIIKVAQAKSDGKYTLPALSFKEPGTYTLLVKINGKTKKIKIVVK